VIANAIIAILVISAVGAFLALLLVIAERFIANYGEVKVNINNGKKEFTAKGGDSLLSTLSLAKIFIPSACGGRGTCGYCKVVVSKGGGPFLPTEEPYIDAVAKADGVRLACQVKVREDIDIQIPRELLAVKEYDCVLEKMEDLTYDVKHLKLALPQGESMDFVAGQYIQFKAPRYKGSPGEVSRAYSIASNPLDKGHIELIIRKVPGGICTTYIFEHLTEGDKVTITGPYGDFHLSDTDAPMLFIATGSGMAPIRSLLHHIANNRIKRKGVFFFGVRSLKDMFMLKEMQAFEKTIPEFRFIPGLSQPEEDDNWRGRQGRVTKLLKEYLQEQSDASNYEAYLCGSPGMIDASIAVLSSFNIPQEKIFYDKF